MDKRVIAVDLDGTLAHYDGWKGVGHIGEIIPSVANAILLAKKEGADIWIFTARVSDPKDAEEAGNAIVAYLTENGIPFDGLTAIKHKFFTEFWDDRAIQVIKNTGEFVMYSDGTPVIDDISMAQAAEAGADNKARIKSVLDTMKNEPAFTPAISALDIQEGGDHYKKYKIQPIEFVVANNIPVLEANAQKYILRHADKNGIGDLRKARHYLELMAEMYYGEKL